MIWRFGDLMIWKLVNLMILMIWKFDDLMIWKLVNLMIWWFDDLMIWWFDDLMIWWFDDLMIWRCKYRRTHLQIFKSPNQSFQIVKSPNHQIKMFYWFNSQANISGTTIVASDSTMNLGVWISSLPQVIFSFGTAPE